MSLICYSTRWQTLDGHGEQSQVIAQGGFPVAGVTVPGRGQQQQAFPCLKAEDP